jgi:hypothetical protein
MDEINCGSEQCDSTVRRRMPEVFRLAAGEGPRPSPERISVLRQRGPGGSSALRKSADSSLLDVEDLTNLANREEENASSFEDEAGGLKKSPLPEVFRLAAGEGQSPSPECISVLRQRGSGDSSELRKPN